jgi:hypothetical protein
VNVTRKKLAVLLGVALVVMVAGTSFALTGEWDFVSGYDDENDALVYGLSEVDDTTAGCEALDGTTVSYGGTTTTTAPPGGGGCELRVVEVANENGVVNHGQAVSSFVRDLKDALKEAGAEGGIGCLVREIAGSDYGKQDDDNTDVTTTTVATTEVSGEVDLTSVEVTCGRPEHAGPPDEESQQGGRPEHAGKPEHAGQGGQVHGG